MPSIYDDLDASTELEQTIARDLAAAFEPRGCEVVHHGSNNGGHHSPGGKPDIELRDPVNRRLVLVEVTKRKGSAADGEFVAITDHLKKAIALGGYDEYAMFYVSPSTSPRMSTNFRDLWNRARIREGEPGRIVAIDFSGFQMLTETLRQADPALYPAARLAETFARWDEAVDDARARQLIQATLFPEEHGLAIELENEAAEVDADREKRLKKQLERIEDKLRDIGVTGNEANVTLVHLAFMRLYEERRQRNTGLQNRFTKDGFVAWRATMPELLRQKHPNRMVQVLLEEIAQDPFLTAAGLLRDGNGHLTQLKPEVTDTRVESLIFSVLDEYDFHAGRLDVLGAVFETLARRSEKDTRIGQFFTPQQVVDFSADLVRLRPTDTVLDPAVGTARFLIAAMQRMLANADEAGLPLDEVQTSIKARQLVGTDIDDWVATIAKMNMFIHGDGKSSVRRVNGLALADTPGLNQFPNGLRDSIDVVLTNPPLGDTSFIVAAEQWADLGEDRTEADQRDFLQTLGVVPGRYSEQVDLAKWEAKVAESAAAIDRLLAEDPPNATKLRAAYRTQASRERRAEALRQAVVAGNLTWRPQGEDLKGGALFLGAIASYLKPARDPNAPLEWRGGQAVVVVDEALLNTPEYQATRVFIREHFYVKAVVSLARDAFRYLAHTDAKTSVLYLIKKPQAGVLQREPIFFAHADRVGYSATGSWVGDDLPQILLQYRSFQDAVVGSYQGAYLDQAQAIEAVRNVPGHADAFFATVDDGTGGDRFDFYNARYRQRIGELTETHGTLPTLRDVLEVHRGERPDPTRNGMYEFAYVAREGEVRPKGLIETGYTPEKLWVVEEGVIALSGIDLVYGAVGVARDDTAGMVMSTEMYAYRVRDDVDAVPEFIQLILKTRTANEMLWGLTTGTSGRTRLETADQLLDLPIPPLPPIEIQETQAAELREALRLRREAATRLASAYESVQQTWRSREPAERLSPKALPLVDVEVS